MHVTIILCTYNGEKFLLEQLKSIEEQEYNDWSLLASDDGSTDQTMTILSNFQGRLGQERINIIKGPGQGYAANFTNTCAQAKNTSDAFAFCDQDDVWHPKKLSTATQRLREFNREKPALYCSRTELIDSEGRHITNSKFFLQTPCFENAMVQSLAGGNTMVFNTAARDMIVQLAHCKYMVAHDWMLYQLVTGAGGTVIYEPWPSISYRQHGDNVIGSNQAIKARLKRLRLLLKGQMKNWNDRNIDCLSEIEDKLTPGARQTLALFKHARAHPYTTLLRNPLFRPFHRQSNLGTAALIIGLLLRRI